MAANQRSAEEWRHIVADWERSGLRRGEFARERGLHPTTLGWWRWRLQSEEPTPDLPAFLDVVIEDEAAQRAPDFDLTVGDVQVRVPLGFDADELRPLLAVLC